MYCLPPGCFAILLPDGKVALRGSVVLDLPAEERAAVLALARGAEQEPKTSAPKVQGDGLDEGLLDTIITLGRGFAWHLENLAGADALVRDLRRLAVKARAFGSLTSLPLLPESATAIALRLAPELGAGDEVLVHGGQLHVGAALAILGHPVTVWDKDEAALDLARALAAENLPMTAREGDALAPLPEELRGRFSLCLVDTLAAHQQETALLSRALSAAKEGGRVVALVHSMRRPLTRRLVAELPVALQEPLHEVAVRLHPGYAPAEFAWDEWVLRKTGEPKLEAARALSAAGARDLDPSEQAHGCVEVQGLSPHEITKERLDRALSLFAAALTEPPLGEAAHDDDAHLIRYVALPAGGQAALTLDKGAGVAAIDLFPWAPAPLAALISALFVELPKDHREVGLER